MATELATDVTTELATDVATAPATTDATVVWMADTKGSDISRGGEGVVAARRGRGVVEVFVTETVATAVVMFVVGGSVLEEFGYGGGVLREGAGGDMGRTALGLDALQSRMVVDPAAAPNPSAVDTR